MKKFLALVLALVMTMSLVTMGTSAAFVDADSIEYDEAVNVLNALGVIEGKGGNTFDPKGGVTRAEMAKMITFIKLGVSDATAFEGTTTDLTDIEGHWAESFIKFCYVEGIIAGKGNGMFDPNANVTTAEAAKMLLVTLGYSAVVQGYVGDQWKVAVIRDAYQNDLFEDIALGADKALNRDEAAKVIYNTVLTNTIEQKPTLNVTTGGVSITYEPSGDSLLETSFEANKYVGQLTFDFDNGYNSTKKEYTYTNVNNGGRFEDEDGFDLANCISKVDYTELLNEEVAVVAKEVATGKYDILGIYPTGKSAVLQDVANAFDVSSAKLKYNGVLYTVEGAADAALANVSADSDDVLKFVDFDGDGKYESASALQFETAKVSVQNDKQVIVKGGTVFTYADDEIADGIAKDDYVSYYEKANGAYVVSEIEPFEAVATAIHGSKNRVEFDGSWYNVGAANKPAKGDFDAGSTYRVWAFNNVVVDKEVVDGKDISNLVMFLDTMTVDFKTKVQYITAAGEKESAFIDTKGGDGIVAAPTVGQLYMISKTDDGVEFYTPTNVGTSYIYDNYDAGSTANNLVDSKHDSAEVDSKIYKIADDAVVFVKGTVGSTATVLTGAQFKALAPTYDAKPNDGDVAGFGDGAALELYIKPKASGLNPRVSHIAVSYTGDAGDITATTGKEIYAYVTADSDKVSLGNESHVRFTIWNGSENLTVYVKGTTAYDKGDVITYKSINDKSVISGVSEVLDKTAGNAAVYAVNGSFVALDGDDNGYKVNGDTKYLYINSNASTAAEIGSAEAASLKQADSYTTAALVMDNIAYVANGDFFTFVLVDVGNSMTRGNTVKVLDNLEDYTDSTSAKRGDRIEFNFGDDTVSVANVVMDDGSAVTSKTGKVIAYATGAGDIT